MAESQDKSLTIFQDEHGNELQLTLNVVKKYLAKNEEISDADALYFIRLCQYQKLNPFLREAYLIGYKDKNGRLNVSSVVGKETFTKRAEAHLQYDGAEAGIIVKNQKGEVEEREGAFFTDADDILGGWARVYRKDRKYCTTSTISMREYSKPYGTWQSIPATMIRKVALVQALREAFPERLGGLYVEEEPQEGQERNLTPEGPQRASTKRAAKGKEESDGDDEPKPAARPAIVEDTEPVETAAGVVEDAGEPENPEQAGPDRPTHEETPAPASVRSDPPVEEPNYFAKLTAYMRTHQGIPTMKQVSIISAATKAKSDPEKLKAIYEKVVQEFGA